MTKNYTIAGIVVLIIIAIIGIVQFGKTSTTLSDGSTPKTTETKKPINNPPVTPLPPASGTQGSVIFTVTDGPASLEGVTSVYMTINDVKMRAEGGAWVTVSNTPRQFDLMQLKGETLPTFLGQVNVEKGNYDAIQLSVSAIVLVKDSVATEAKIPSGKITINNTKVTVGAKKTSSVKLDFLADKSFHVTGDGKYIFTPVIAAETKSDVQIQMKSENRVDIIGGVTTYNANLGMDENGVVKVGFVFDGYTTLNVVGNIIQVTGKDDKSTQASVSGETATTKARESGYIDVALSLKSETRNGVLVWKVVGTKNLTMATVYIDAKTGAVVGRE